MPVIGYNLNIPFATHNPSTDQPNMLTNTNAINTLVNVDHYTFDDSKAGTHKQVSLTNEAAPGIPAGSSGVHYANLANGQSWPFWQNSLGSFQILGRQSIAADGYISLGGIIFQWGSTTAVTSSSSTPVVFPLTFPTAVFSVQATIVTNDNSTIRFSILNDATTAGFTTSQTSSSHFTRLYWFAVGN
jgi:hypothetical protein